MFAIRGEATAGHDHVQGVQHRGDGDAGAEVLGIGSDRERGLGGGLE
jgi:hypothetical protein